MAVNPNQEVGNSEVVQLQHVTTQREVAPRSGRFTLSQNSDPFNLGTWSSNQVKLGEKGSMWLKEKKRLCMKNNMREARCNGWPVYNHIRRCRQPVKGLHSHHENPGVKLSRYWRSLDSSQPYGAKLAWYYWKLKIKDTDLNFWNVN